MKRSFRKDGECFLAETHKNIWKVAEKPWDTSPVRRNGDEERGRWLGRGTGPLRWSTGGKKQSEEIANIWVTTENPET